MIQKRTAARKQDGRLLAVTLLLVFAAFIADWLLPLGVAGGVLFMVPVALTLWFVQPAYTWVVAGISAVLIILDLFLKPASEVPFYFVVINRSYAFLAIGIVVGIGHLQRRLARQNERLTALSVLEERERLSRELHDDLSQLLGGIGARASAVSELLAQGRADDAKQEVSRLRDSAGEAYLSVRQYITGLRVSPWGEHRFPKVLEDIAQYFAEQAQLKFRVDVAQDIATLKLSPAAEIQAIRILQEALSNTTRYANAKNVLIKVGLNENLLQITIQDDGQGFEPSHIDTSRHLGLQMMRERAEIVGGQLTISSAPGSGTSVTVALPCQKGEK